MVDTKYSFATIGGKQFTGCMECTKGINGEQSCSNGVMVTDVKQGCWSGQLMDMYKEGGDSHGNTGSNSETRRISGRTGDNQANDAGGD